MYDDILKDLETNLSFTYGNNITQYDSGYICDVFSEIADSNVDIYTSDLFEWGKSNMYYIDEATKEFGNPNDILRQIQQGQYYAYEQELYENQDDIIKYFAYSYLKDNNIKVVVHIINGLPYETKEDMLNTTKLINSLNVNAVKIHMLHVMKNTPLGKMYEQKPFPLLSLEEYVDIVVDELRNLNENIVIQRITGDAPKDLLLAPKWTLKKFVVMNEIDKMLRKKNYYQGDLCSK